MSSVRKALQSRHQSPAQFSSSEDRFVRFLDISPAIFSTIRSTATNATESKDQPEFIKGIVESNSSRSRFIKHLGSYDADIYDIVDEFLLHLARAVTTTATLLQITITSHYNYNYKFSCRCNCNVMF